ncbi:extracellular solute-binding protein [Aerococcus agrisoli]|uniref:Extracellular solute-binding protein n=1 Tax=Aerococcus agrisoli TaxID=2487350 RepID=A0A3N4G0S1_9LACT|nr:ABC transporter substrate-binding protein [Aerococcus agrisoli]RPA55898.1 extracellular solute-binding protein [Aerococcus agrisoli]
MKNWKKLMVVFASGAALAACGNSEANLASSSSSSDASSTSSQASNGELIVSTFALNQDTVENIVMTPFEEANGVSTVLEVGTASERLTKLASGNSTVDVIELSQINASQGDADGLFEEVTAEDVPNIDNLTDGAKEVLESGAGVPYAVNSIGIVYDPTTLGSEPKEWADLWSSDYEGQIAIPDIATTFGPAMVYVGSDYKGIDITTDNGEAGFQALSELKPNIVKTYEKSSDLVNMFQAGEIQVAVVADFAYEMIKEANPNAVYVVPESGTYANYNTVNLVKGSQNTDLAYDYINARISPELEEQTAEQLNEAPVNTEVTLSDELAANKTYGDIAERAKTIDTTFVNENLADWITNWNEIINQ